MNQKIPEVLWKARQMYMSDPKSVWIELTLKATADYRFGLVGTDQAKAAEQIRLILEFANYMFGK